MQHHTIRRVLLAGAFTAGAWIGLSALDADDAHAADKKPAAAVQLPEQASDKAKAAVTKVSKPKCEPGKKPAKPKPPAEDQGDEPVPKPDPKPTEDQPPADKPDKPAEDKPAEDPKPEPDPIVELPPLDPPLPELPTIPLPPLPELPPAPTAPAPTAPVVIGPVAGTTPAATPANPPPGPAVAALITALTAGPDQPALCGDPDDAPPIDRDALRALLRVPDEPPAAERTSKPCQPEPADNATSGATASSGQTGATHAADLTGSHVPPTLARLEHARPRSTIPASRHTSVEPGPA
ncbi:hypothetical protein [Micromonospora sp. DT47]|uniref:hypothetical protein n=1 Tax=Micromonospora sp. DT47 TaxID=3393431 RepID=UPI003CFAC0C5